MEKPKLITSYDKFNSTSRILENEDIDIDMDETILDELVELVGSEEDVEECAREAFEDLQKSFERNELEMTDGDVVENLVISALIVKLVEKGKLSPDEADLFLEERI